MIDANFTAVFSSAIINVNKNNIDAMRMNPEVINGGADHELKTPLPSAVPPDGNTEAVQQLA